MTALVEYLIRLRLEEPAGALPPGQVGDAMHALLGEIEAVAVEQEIVSRVVLAGPDRPSRVRCAARGLDPTRHFATATRYTLTTPAGLEIVTCSVACAVDWLVKALPADLAAGKGDTATRAREGEAAA